jgi:L-asparagine transporter-like permease
MKPLRGKIKKIYSIIMKVYIGILSVITIIFCLLAMWSKENNYLWLFWIIVFCCILLIPLIAIYIDMRGKRDEPI